MTQNEIRLNITNLKDETSELKIPILKGLVYCAYLTYGSSFSNQLISEFNLKNLYNIDGYYYFILDDIITESKKSQP